VAALVALVFGVSAFGDEREDGTILYLVATPQPRLELVIAKVAGGLDGPPWLLLVPSLVLSGPAGPGARRRSLRLIGWPLVGVVLASLAYCAALVLAVAEDAAAGGDRRHLHPALGRVGRDLCGVRGQALDLGLRQRLRRRTRWPQSAPPVAGLVPSALVLAAVVVLAAWGAARSLGPHGALRRSSWYG
jgi:hypothetical protein